MLKPLYLTRRDITKLEEAMSSDDLETMVATVDQIVKGKLARAAHTRPIGTKPRSANEEWFQKKFYEFNGTNREQILEDMRVKLATLPEADREMCGCYLRCIQNPEHR